MFSGVANAVITGDQLDVPVAYESMQAAGLGMGSAGFIVYDETACMVEVARLFSHFLHVESCAQDLPCKLGSEAITERLARVEGGVAGDADFDVISA